MKKLLISLLFALLVISYNPIFSVLASNEQYKLVIQMSSYDEKAQKRTLMRINQLLKAMDNDNVIVEVVAIGPAFNLVAKNKEKKLLSLDSKEGGKFVKEVKNLMKKGVDTVKSAASDVKDKVVKRVERRKENVAIDKRIKEKQSQPDASSGKTKAQVMALQRKKDKLNNPKKPQLSGKQKAQALAKARLAAKSKIA